MVECVSLGLYHCAVGFLLATPPDQSPRCCQGALCAMALRRDCLRDLKSAAAVLAAAIATVAAAAEQTPSRRLPHDLTSACSTSINAAGCACDAAVSVLQELQTAAIA